MKAKYLFTFLFCSLLVSCGPSDTECAQTLLDEARLLVDNGQWRQARIVLDSLHATYPREVEQRRIAKAMEDNITYMEAERTLAYADSILPPLLTQADKLLKQFKYEKNEKYEDKGRYVHRLLNTGSNTARNFLQHMFETTDKPLSRVITMVLLQLSNSRFLFHRKVKKCDSREAIMLSKPRDGMRL